MLNLNLGVSSCLLAHAVRYDGKHKHHEIITTKLGETFNLIPFCPEVAIGMGVPRPPIHLVDINGIVHAVNKAHATPDYTQQLQQQGNKYLAENLTLHGFILQEKSPSCGYQSVKLHDIAGEVINTQSTGIFTASLLALLPDIPIIESISLDNKQAIKDFIQQVQAYANNHLAYSD